MPDPQAPAFVDLAPFLARADRGYVEVPAGGSPASNRVHAVAWCAADARLYVVVAERFVFWSDDEGRSWHEVAEVNRRGGALTAPGTRAVDAIVDTPTGAVLLIGRERSGEATEGAVWRKPAGAPAFARHGVAGPAWESSKAGNATAGWFGHPPRPLVALAVYASPPALWFSADDGLSWRRQDLASVYAEHVHEVYLPRAANVARTARLWVSGGDDPSGEASGVVTFSTLEADGTLGGMRWALRERPGYRLVGLAGDGKHVYIGNESLAGGVLRLLDDAQSIETGDVEYAFGKARHDYHQFRSLVATPDGLVASATDSYAFLGDTLRADSGGYLYVSNDGGASFHERSLGMKWIVAMACDGRALWLAGGMNRESGEDPGALRLALLRVPVPAAYADLGARYCAKAVVVDSSAFYARAGYPAHPRPVLAPGECTFRVDLAPYRTIVVRAEAYGAADLVVEGLAFRTWHPDEEAWRPAGRLRLDAAGVAEVLLDKVASHYRWYRVRNAGAVPVALREVVLTGRR